MEDALTCVRDKSRAYSSLGMLIMYEFEGELELVDGRVVS